MAKTKITKIFAFTFTIAGIIILGIIIVCAIYQKEDFFTKGGALDLQKGNNLGGFVGGFAGVFFTLAGVLLLYRTLQLQREEFSKTQVAITTQQFETTLFNMLNVLHNIVLSLDGEFKVGTDYKMFSGYRYFQKCLDELKERITVLVGNRADLVIEKVRNLEEILTTDYSNLESELSIAYADFYKQHHTELGHYFRYLYNIIKFVLDNRELEDDKRKYLNLVQAQLSNQELGMVFYNVNSELGKNASKIKQFRDWLDYYSLLENMDENSLQNKCHHILLKNTQFKFQTLDETAWKLNGMKPI